MKAQRIIVPAAVTAGSDSEYVGLWHIDGQLEHVVAVVLYYYHKDDALQEIASSSLLCHASTPWGCLDCVRARLCVQGGAMEFADRAPIDVVGGADGGDSVDTFGKESANRSLSLTLALRPHPTL